MTVPKRGDSTLARSTGQDTFRLLPQKHHIPPHQDVGPQFHSHRSLCILAYRQARDIQIRCLFLNPAGVGDHELCPLLQTQKIQIANRID